MQVSFSPLYAGSTVETEYPQKNGSNPYYTFSPLYAGSTVETGIEVDLIMYDPDLSVPYMRDLRLKPVP